MWEELGRLFREMSAWTIGLLLLGVVLIIIDAFDTGFDLTGLAGIVSVVAGIVIRMLNGGTWLMFFVMLLMAAAVVAVAVFLIFRSATKGWLSRTALFDPTPAVPYDKTEGTPDYTDLVGKEGQTATVLRPVGRVKIDDAFYDAVCEDSFIENGVPIEVTAAEGCKLTVRAK